MLLLGITRRQLLGSLAVLPYSWPRYAAMRIGDGLGLNETISGTIAICVFVGAITMFGR